MLANPPQPRLPGSLPKHYSKQPLKMKHCRRAARVEVRDEMHRSGAAVGGGEWWEGGSSLDPSSEPTPTKRPSSLLTLDVSATNAEKTSGAPLPNARNVTPATSGGMSSFRPHPHPQEKKNVNKKTNTGRHDKVSFFYRIMSMCMYV